MFLIASLGKRFSVHRSMEWGIYDFACAFHSDIQNHFTVGFSSIGRIEERFYGI